jgi:hypothetical protein
MLQRYPSSPMASSEEESEDWDDLLGKDDAHGEDLCTSTTVEQDALLASFWSVWHHALETSNAAIQDSALEPSHETAALEDGDHLFMAQERRMGGYGCSKAGRGGRPKGGCATGSVDHRSSRHERAAMASVQTVPNRPLDRFVRAPSVCRASLELPL